MYKSPLSGNWFTIALFYETSRDVVIARRSEVCEPVFTFTARPGYIDFKSSFIETDDPTGYTWAMNYLGSYDHFLYLMKRPWFSEQYEKAKAELLAKHKAAALKRILDLSSCENAAQALAASKYLAERGWEKSPVGRPKEKVAGEVKAALRDLEEVDNDIARLGLTLIPGGRN